MAGKVVDREASERGANGCHAVAVDIREIVGSIIDGREIVVDALAGPVARNGLTPLMTETGQATTVGGNHHIALRGHNHEVPTVAPELADWALRTAFTEEQGRIFLGLVEIWRQDNPVEQVLSVSCLGPALLHFRHSQLVEDMLVLEGNLLNGGSRSRQDGVGLNLLRRLHLLGARRNHIEVGTSQEAVALGQDALAVVHHLQTAKVGPVVGELAQLALPVDRIEVEGSVPYTCKVDEGILGVAPAERVDI